MDFGFADEREAYREAMLGQGDFDEVSIVGGMFGFCTFGSKQKRCKLLCFSSSSSSSSSSVSKKEKGSKGQEDGLEQIASSHSESEDVDSNDVNNLENFYERFELIRCQVNIFAMKRFIRLNIKSLREIKLEDCRFYLSDEDAAEMRNQVMNQRMLQELNFVWLIEQFKFQDIMSIDIKLLKEQFSEKTQAIDLKRIFKRKSAKIMAMNFNQSSARTSNNSAGGAGGAAAAGKASSFKRKITTIGKDTEQDDTIEIMPESDMKKYFSYSDDSRFMQYETREKDQFKQTYTKEYLRNFAQDLIWGDVQDQERFIDKYYDNSLIDIQQNLAIYKKYTKYAFNDGKLAIIGDVLYNGMSLNQLYNVIQLNCKQINGIIFKDNGKIPPKAFSDLMKQIFLIPSLEQISFLSSVLDESSLYELQYLIEKKDVRFLNLYRSYFLKDELIEVLQMSNSKHSNSFHINHHRFVVIDIAQKKAYEFTPFSFNINELKAKKRENLLEVQRLYSAQMFYPKQVYNQIVFFQGMNLSLINQNGSERILFAHWDLLNQSKDVQKLWFQSKQDELISILDDQFREDDVNLLNFSLLKLLISLVIEREQQRTFEKLLYSSKSFKLLKENFAIQVVEKIKYTKLQYLQTAYAYIYGFTRIKEVSLIYVFNNTQLYKDVRENNQEYAKRVRDENSALMLKESFGSNSANAAAALNIEQEKDLNANGKIQLSGKEIKEGKSSTTSTASTSLEILKQIQLFVEFKSLVELRLENISDAKMSFSFLNLVLPLCVKLKTFSLANSMLSNGKIADVKFGLVPAGLEHFDVSSNKNLEDLRFVNSVLETAKSLKSLKLNDLQMGVEKASTIQFSLLPASLEAIDISSNEIQDVTFLQSIFGNAFALRRVNLAKTSLTNALFTQIRFSASLKELILNSDSNSLLTLDCVLVHLGLIPGIALEVIEAFGVDAASSFDPIHRQYFEKPGMLPGFRKLSRVELQHNNLMSSECVNLILANAPMLRSVEISEQGLTEESFKTIQLSNCYASLEVLDLSYGHKFESFAFLVDVFGGAKRLSSLNLSYSSIDDKRLGSKVIELLPVTLEKFLFSGNSGFVNFTELLNSLFKRCIALKELRINECGLNDEKLEDVEFNAMSTAVEIFDISMNPLITRFTFLNTVFRRTPKLRQIYLQEAKISKVNDIMFDLLSDTVEVFSADEVESVSQENAADQANVVALAGSVVVAAAAAVDGNGEGRDNKATKVISDGFFDDEFQDWLVNKLERYMNIRGFQEKHSNVENFSLINYFGVFEQQNLSQYRSSGMDSAAPMNSQKKSDQIQNGSINGLAQSIIIPLDEVSNKLTSKLEGLSGSMMEPMTPMTASVNNVNASKGVKLSDEEEAARQKRRKRHSEWAEKFKIDGFKENDWVESSRDVDYQRNPNVLFFYSILKKLDQLVSGDTGSILEGANGGVTLNGSTNNSNSKLNLAVLIEKIVEYQNVYNSKDYALIQFIDTQMIKDNFLDASRTGGGGGGVPRGAAGQQQQQVESQDSKIDYDMYFQALKVINMAGQRYSNLEFLSFFLERGHQIMRIDMSNMELTSEVVSTIRLSGFESSQQLLLPVLEELDFSGNKCTSTNIFSFVHMILVAAPKLRVLSLRDMDMHGDAICDFKLVSDSLEELDISKNRRLESLTCLNVVFTKCKGLKKLNVSATNLSAAKLKGVNFLVVNAALEEFDCSDNETLKLDIIFVNEIIDRCQSLKKLNISKCCLDYNANGSIWYSKLSKQCLELNLSKNQIVYYMEFLSELIAQCPMLIRLDMSGQTHQNQYGSEHKEFVANSLQELDFSGNRIYNTYPYVAEIIEKSNSFRRLTIRNMNLTQARLKAFALQTIGKKIEELDISNNLEITDVSSLNTLNSGEKEFRVLIANATSLNNAMLKSLQIVNVCRNLTRLELADNIHFIKFDFLNQIMSAAQKLEVLNLSGMQIVQQQLGDIDFSLMPRTLREFEFNDNPYVDDFECFNRLFRSTKESLRKFGLRNCDLREEKFSKTDFSLLSKSIEVLDISSNENLNTIQFVVPIFEKSPLVHMKVFKISKSTYEIALVLQKYCSQIEKIDCPFQKLDFEFFAKKKANINLNMIKFLQYLLSNFQYQNFAKRSQTQIMFSSGDQKGKIFKEILRNIMEFKSEMKPLQTILHFFFLLVNEDQLLSKAIKPEFFIMSPYSFFSQQHAINCTTNNNNNTSSSSQKKKENRQSEELPLIDQKKNKKHSNNQQMIIDSYNLCFFDLNLLHQQTDFIFGYDKFFFSEFPDFYVQNLHEKHSDLKFMVRLKARMDMYGVSNAFLPIRLQLTPDALKAENLSEFQVLNLINFIPPASMVLKGMSIQFVKSWYAINFYAPLSVNTLIDVDYDLLENSSIANFLTLRSYRLYIRNFEAKTFSSRLKMLFGYFCYSFFNVLSSQPKQFRFDHTVIHLENRFKLDAIKGRYSVLRFLFPVYLFVCIFGVWYFSFSEDISCGKGLSWNSYYTYAGFGLITFFIEAYIFLVCLKYVPHLVPELKPDCRISFPYPMINGIKTFIMDVWWINQWYVNYVISFALSQLSRFDFFTNLGFIFTTYQCGDYLISLLALISNGITLFSNIVFFFMNFIGDDTYGRLVTGQIDRLYQICNLLEFQAVADVLDIVSPSNSVLIFGKMFNQRIVNNFIRIIFQDVPLIVIQALYLVRSGQFSSTMLFSLISSGLMFLVSLKKFLTITPSRLGQEDFNELNVIKKKKVLPKYLKSLSEYESKVVAYNQFEMLKCVKSTSYFESSLMSDHPGLTEKEIKMQIQMAKDLRQFQPNAESIKEFFGDSKYTDEVKILETKRDSIELASAVGPNRRNSGGLLLNMSPKDTNMYGFSDAVHEQGEVEQLIKNKNLNEPLQKQNSIMSMKSIKKLAEIDDADEARKAADDTAATKANGLPLLKGVDTERDEQSREQMIAKEGDPLGTQPGNKKTRKSMVEEKQNYEIMFGDKSVVKKLVKKGKKR